jgi:hypothetical protein
MAIQGNLPQQGYKSSDEPVREFFDSYYKAKLEFPANQVDAVLAFFDKRGFEKAAAASVSTILLQQAKIDNVPVFKLLDTLSGLNDVQMSTLITEILNYNRAKTSTLGFRLEPQTSLIEARNIEQFTNTESDNTTYMQPGYVLPGYVL